MRERIIQLADRINQWAKDEFDYEYFDAIQDTYNASEQSYIEEIRFNLMSRNKRFAEVLFTDLTEGKLYDNVKQWYSEGV